MEPFDEWDPHHPIRGRKRFNSNYRPQKSKINLQIHAEEARAFRHNNKVTVKQSFLDEFDKQYAENCN